MCREAARQAAQRRKLALTTIGSSRVDIEATPAALTEAAGGVTLWIRHARGTPLEKTSACALTAAEAKQLVCAVADVITQSCSDFRPREPLVSSSNSPRRPIDPFDSGRAWVP